MKEEILNFDARQITKEMRTSVSKLLKQKGSSFEHANIYRVSVSAAPLAAWVKANIRYSLVLTDLLSITSVIARGRRIATQG